ncbi:hypothetical protein C9374_000911 [Naegleria lovaniensis]|uniref:RGS domain-containing protein n=1 Tax=Naegleria lovaniensis TaxID=51637 RepID=A0AA88KNX1_NAELO|nr:uncharacterized protein C9374_000911 [Naegleria lovaniensis]KAG2388061.1 hypothetical protein C9374_000911 [Naegleria lovaniensis]
MSSFTTPLHLQQPPPFVYALFSLLQSSTNNSTTPSNETICDPILLNNGTEKVEYGLCPEQVSSQAVTGIFFGTYVIALIATTLGIIFTRHVPLIKYRGVAVMIASLLMTGLFAMLFNLRMTIGRKVFPCFIYILFYFFAAPVVFLPTLLRLWRLLWMSRLNKTRVELFRLEAAMIKSGQESQSRKRRPTAADQTNNNNEPSGTMMGDHTMTMDTNSPVPAVTILTSFADDEYSVDTDSDSDTDSTSDAGSVMMEMEQDFSSSSGSQSDLFGNHTANGSSPLPLIPNSNVFNTTTSNNNGSDAQSGGQVPTNLKRQLSKASALHKTVLANTVGTVALEELGKYIALEKKILRMQHITSWWFYLIVVVVLSAFHLFVWLICGLVETFVLNSSPSSTKFTVSNDFFVFAHGCGVGMGTLIAVALEGFLYVIGIGVVLVFTLREDNDTWRLRWETLSVIVFWAVWLILYLVCGFIPIIQTLTDAYFPYGDILFFGVVTDNIITAVIPVVRALLILVPKEQEEQNEEQLTREKAALVKLLKNKKMFEILLAFAKQSFCPESVLAWKEMQMYRRKGNAKSRRKLAKAIYNKYIKPDSPMELNLPSKFNKEEIGKMIDDTSQPLPKDFFRTLSNHCEQDMKDVLDRLRKRDKRIQEFMLKNTVVATEKEAPNTAPQAPTQSTTNGESSV